MIRALRRRRSRAPAALRIAGVVLAFGFAFPGVYLVYRALRDGTGPEDLLWSARTLGPLWRSLRLAVSVSASALVLGTGLAWLTMRTDLPLRKLWRGPAAAAARVSDVRGRGCVHPRAQSGWAGQ